MTFKKLARAGLIAAALSALTGIVLVSAPMFDHSVAYAQAPAATPALPVPPPQENSDAVKFQIGTTVEEAEKGLILRTLEHTRNNKTRAAEILGISLKTLHNKLKEYGAGKEFGIGASIAFAVATLLMHKAFISL